MTGGQVAAAVAVRQHAGGNEQTVGEHGRSVGPAVVVRVFEDNDPVRGGLAGLDLGVHFGAGDPEAAARVPIDFNRLVQLRVFGPEIHLEALSDVEGGQRLRLDFGFS